MANQDKQKNDSFICEMKTSENNEDPDFAVLKSGEDQTFFKIYKNSQPTSGKIISNLESYESDDLVFLFENNIHKIATSSNNMEQNIVHGYTSTNGWIISGAVIGCSILLTGLVLLLCYFRIKKPKEDIPIDYSVLGE